jgi:hypothetical protein
VTFPLILAEVVPVIPLVCQPESPDAGAVGAEFVAVSLTIQAVTPTSSTAEAVNGMIRELDVEAMTKEAIPGGVVSPPPDEVTVTVAGVVLFTALPDSPSAAAPDVPATPVKATDALPVAMA